MSIPLFCVDAFTSLPFKGNPAAVAILDNEAPEEWMQNVAAEMNLAETAFVVKQKVGEYGLRWFTPATEVDLCGHATLAAAYVLWEEELERSKTITFHTKSGALIAKQDGEAIMDRTIAIDLPVVEVAPALAPAGLMAAMGLPTDLPVYLGERYCLIELESEAAVLAVAPDFSQLKKVSAFGVIVTAEGSEPEVDFVSRFFAPAVGVDEDPVTGSAHCRLAPYWSRKLKKENLSAKQISRRGGELNVRLPGDGRVILQGRAALVWRGAINTSF
ncbi:MAG: PhzF family phenazine biosynthesis protein [Nitrospinota bacterium]|nr:PhzF family phenazine biosynthesis protein [Nitrospinota bacterium]